MVLLKSERYLNDNSKDNSRLHHDCIKLIPQAVNDLQEVVRHPRCNQIMFLVSPCLFIRKVSLSYPEKKFHTFPRSTTRHNFQTTTKREFSLVTT